MNGKTSFNKTDSKDMNVSFESGDNKSPTSFQDIDLVESKETHKSIFKKISIMIKNIRYLYNLIGDPNLIGQLGFSAVTAAISSPGNPRNFSNMNLNNINIDKVYNYNYVTAVSVNDGTFGTLPGDGWFNIVNFFTYHFTTQIALNCGDTSSIWIRAKYINSDTFTQWREISEIPLKEINDKIGSTNISELGTTITNSLKNLSCNSIRINSRCTILPNKTKKADLFGNSIYIVVCCPWNMEYNCQSIFLVSTLSQVSIQCLNSDTNKGYAELSRYGTEGSILQIKNKNEQQMHVLVYDMVNSSSTDINWAVDDGTWTEV